MKTDEADLPNTNKAKTITVEEPRREDLDLRTIEEEPSKV
jgi:hypothetical protein